MISRTVVLIIFFLVITGFIVALGALQIFLSRRDSKWPGLVLPIASFGLSLIVTLGLGLFTIISVESGRVFVESYDISMVTENDNTNTGERLAAPIVENTHYTQTMIMPGSSTIFAWLAYFIIMNIPTILFAIIYIVCRSERKKVFALNKMSVQDLG